MINLEQLTEIKKGLARVAREGRLFAKNIKTQLVQKNSIQTDVTKEEKNMDICANTASY